MQAPILRVARLTTLTLLTAFGLWAIADTVALNPNHPERYTVQKGDTLWDISGRFLRDPWQWASVWKINDQIKNPHLIYPGDVIMFAMVDGKPQLSVLRTEKVAPAPAAAPTPAAPTSTPTPGPVIAAPTQPIEPEPTRPTFPGATRLKPKVYAEELREAIPTISPDKIVPFLTQPLVVSKYELASAGYVALGVDDRVALGTGAQFYARNLGDEPHDFYYVFRPGKALKNPDNNETLGYEAIYLGDAQLVTAGETSKLQITRVKQEILPTDRLIPAERTYALPYYYPRAPQQPVRGRVVGTSTGMAVFGPNAVIAISLGKREGIEEGHVLRVQRDFGKRPDPITGRNFRVPLEDSGLVMVFRVFDTVSYALVMNASRPLQLHDYVVTP